MCTSICVWKLPRIIYFGRHTYLFRLLKHSQYILVDFKTAMKKKKWFCLIPSSPSLMDGVRLNLKVWDIQSIFKLLRQGFSALAPMTCGADHPFQGGAVPSTRDCSVASPASAHWLPVGSSLWMATTQNLSR